MSVLVTGGAGYIGSHVALALAERGEDVIVLDNLSTGRRELVPDSATLVVGELGDSDLLERILAEHRPEAVLHFAARTVVPESVAMPLAYWKTNTIDAHALLTKAVEHDVQHVLYSSTAAVYGNPSQVLVPEALGGPAINPYGMSKYAFERMLFDVADATSITCTALRYFNVAGADPALRTGQATPRATHLIKVAVQAALGERDGLDIFGTDWDTRDGTCIRDYIHVSDLAELHVLALERLRAGGSSEVFNCGYGRGYTVREVVDTVRDVCGDFDVRDAARRPGDPEALIADTTRLQAAFDWTPQHADLDHIVRTAFAWEEKLAQLY